jgi:hypothetical protein
MAWYGMGEERRRRGEHTARAVVGPRLASPPEEARDAKQGEDEREEDGQGDDGCGAVEAAGVLEEGAVDGVGDVVRVEVVGEGALHVAQILEGGGEVDAAHEGVDAAEGRVGALRWGGDGREEARGEEARGAEQSRREAKVRVIGTAQVGGDELGRC